MHLNTDRTSVIVLNLHYTETIDDTSGSTSSGRSVTPEEKQSDLSVKHKANDEKLVGSNLAEKKFKVIDNAVNQGFGRNHPHDIRHPEIECSYRKNVMEEKPEIPTWLNQNQIEIVDLSGQNHCQFYADCKECHRFQTEPGTTKKIGDHLGSSNTAAYKAVTKALGEVEEETRQMAKLNKTLDLQRPD